MGFWTKKTVAVEPLPAPTREAFIYNGAAIPEWHESRVKELLSHDDFYFQEQFDFHRDLILSFVSSYADTQTTAERAKVQEVQRYFSYLSQQYLQFDRRYLSETQIGSLYYLIYRVLPELTQTIRINVIKKQEENKLNFLIPQLTIVLSSLQTNLGGLEVEYVKHMAVNANRKLKEIFNNPDVEEAPIQPLKLPVFKISKLSVEKAYSEVSSLWVQAMSLSNSVEHEFFLERTATHYLPDVLKVYAPFQKAIASEQENADTMLLEYLATLERKLYEILGSAMRNSLSDLKVEVDFMNAKVGPDEATSLLSLKKITS